ncbi:MAG TPA: heavy-metal-associated domain-containing protein [Burkholderiales bacterium]|jgi:copper chaperone
METIKIGIKGMTCGGCVASVKRVLTHLDGVQKVDVSLEQQQATVEYTPGRVDPARLRSAIEGAGFEVAR